MDGLWLQAYTWPKVVVDATLGLAGHASGAYSQLGPEDAFIAFDAFEPNFITSSKTLEDLKASRWKQAAALHLVHANFSTLAEQLSQLGISHITHLYADLGVSSVHFDDADSTFSYRHEAPLDMRLDPTQTQTSAADIVADTSFEDLVWIFRKYGDEKDAGRIARAIVADRGEKPFRTTTDLSGLIERVTHSKKSVARCFQALRIAVNDEYGALEKLLSSAKDMIVPGGRVSIISFHSWEDRIVKHVFREWSLDVIDDITGQISVPARFELVTKKPIIPTTKEIEKNPRSRSAKLRIIQCRH